MTIIADNKILVKNVEGEPETEAHIIYQNNIDFVPKVSVIIPVYNVEQYLRECLDSVVNQTLKEIEIICVDDGSTDSSLEILKEYAEKDNRFTIISRENKGVGYSRNEGINISLGEFIAFMDPDDYYSDLTILETMYKSAIESNVLISGGSLIIYDESQDKEIEKKDFYNKFQQNGIIKYGDYQYDYGFQKFIYSSKLIKENNIFFPNYRRFQDPPFMIKAMAIAGKFFALEKATYTYRWSHKEVAWTEEKIYHLLLGLKDNLNLAIENNLEKLFETTLTRIKNEYKGTIAKENSERIKEVKNEIMKICLNKAKNVYSNNQNKPKISAILPIYNASEYLKECLDSIINQTLKEIEIICVNDGSTDNSLDIIKEYAQKDSRIKYIDKPNAGYGQTINCGLDLAQGEYIGIVEPDDYIELDMYEKLYKKAEEEGVDVIKSNSKVFIGDYDKRTFSLRKVNISEVYENSFNPINIPLLFKFANENVTGIYKRDFLKKYNIRHNETPGASFQDIGFAFQIFSNVNKMYYLEDAFYNIRRDNPNSSVKDPAKVMCPVYEYQFIEKILKRDNLRNKYIKLFNLKKYYSYKFTLTRIDNSYKAMFVSVFSKEFKKAYKKNELDQFLFSKQEWKEILLIINNPNKYCKDCLRVEPLKSSLAQNVFSITNSNDKKHKIITILGIKIKFKRRKKGEIGFIQNIFSVKNEHIRKQHKIITIFGLKFKIKRKQAGGYSFAEKIFSVKNREAKDNKWYKVICILGIKFKFKNKELTQRRQLQAIEQRINQVCNFQEHQFKQMSNKLNSTTQNIDKQIKETNSNIKNSIQGLNSALEQSNVSMNNSIQNLNSLLEQSEKNLCNSVQNLSSLIEISNSSTSNTIQALENKIEQANKNLQESILRAEKNNASIINETEVLKNDFQEKYTILDKNSAKLDNIIKNQNEFLTQYNLKSNFEFERCKEIAKQLEGAELTEKYKKLIKGLDENSIECIFSLLAKVKRIASSDSKSFDIFTDEEIKQITKLRKEYYPNILQLAENCYAYKQYLLPIKHFEASVFYYKHNIDDLKDLAKIKNKSIIDVGAFIGDSAIVFEPYTDKKIYSFEPTKENYEHLLKTIELNESKKIVPINKALGSKDEELEIYLQDSGSSINRVITENPAKEKIQVTTLDKFVKENNLEIGLIKVDIEGFEQEFLKGAFETIKAQKPTLLISIYHNASDFFDIKPMIESWNLGYKFRIVKPIDGGIRGETLLIAEQE